VCGMSACHADFTRQKVSAFAPSEDFDLYDVVDDERPPMVSLSPLCHDVAFDAGAVVVRVIDHVPCGVLFHFLRLFI